MKLLFKMEDQVHIFTTLGDLTQNDLGVLRESLMKFIETSPQFTVLDLSECTILTDHAELLRVKGELKTLANAKGIHLSIAETDIEARHAKRSVLEAALRHELAILQNKIEIRENIRKEAEKLLVENVELKSIMNDHLMKLKSEKPADSLIQPIVEKLWSER